jgi:hypothetical protein
VLDASGNIVSTAGKGVGDTVTGVTQGLGDTTKGMILILRWEGDDTDNCSAGGNFVKDTTRSGTDTVGLTEAEKQQQAKQ